MNKALPESIQDVIKLKNETQPVKEVLYNFCCCQGGSPGGSSDQVEVQYSMLNQSDKDVFGKENFDNVNFDYDDFNSSSGLLANWNEIFFVSVQIFWVIAYYQRCQPKKAPTLHTVHDNHIANLVGVKNYNRLLILQVSQNTCLFTEDEISAVTGPNKGGNQAKSIA